MERKYHPLGITAAPQAQSYGLELKSLSADGRFAGYASVFGVVDSQRDVVRPGAFRRSLKTRNAPVQLLWQHQWDEPIGSIDALFEDPRGLYVEGRLLMDVARAREAFALMKAGVVKGLSIGYSAKSFRRDPDSGVRELLEVELFEISLVTLPANAAAQVTVLKSSTLGADTIAALEMAVKAALPSITGMAGKAKQASLALLHDIAQACYAWRAKAAQEIRSEETKN